MQIKSVSKPTGQPAMESAQKLAPRDKTVATTASSNAAATGSLAKKGLAVGKRTAPLAPRGGRVTLETVIGLDERTRIRDTDQAPWRMICSLSIDSPDGSFIGTGWFAGPRTIITAGHCVFDNEQMGGWADTIVVTPGRDEDDAPVGKITAKRFSTVDRWETHREADFDIGVIHLDKPLGDKTGWFRTASLPDAQLENYMVNVAGYPGDRGNGEQLWWAKNRIRAVTARRIFYDVDTYGGQSGGPAFIIEEEGAAPTVVGIHAYGTGGTPTSIQFEVNSAPRIIPEVVEQIRAWVEQDGGGEVKPKTKAKAPPKPKKKAPKKVGK